MDLIVMAKAPLAGRVKTRLVPALTPDQAATIAAAALEDTLETATQVDADRVLLALDGPLGPWCPAGIEVIDQGVGPLDRRLERVWSLVDGPAVVIGMDTPQLSPALLDSALEVVAGGGDRAVLGPAVDGGWWLLGAGRTVPGVFTGIETSRADTGRRQLERLLALRLHTTLVAVLRDVDTIEDAHAVASEIPGSRFSAAVTEAVEACLA